MNLLEHLTAAEARACLARAGLPLPERQAPVRPFLGGPCGPIRLIAEYKRRSPSHGPFPDQSLGAVLRRYETAGAAAISVLVAAEGFAGSLDDLQEARALTSLPLLYKGFVSQLGQLDEAYAFGADAVLLITAVLGADLAMFVRQAEARGLGALVEVHSERELHQAQDAGARLIGVNNRDLASLACDVDVFLDLAPRVAPGVTLVAESGYRAMADIRAAERAGAHAVLVGEALLARDGRLLDAWARAQTHVG